MGRRNVYNQITSPEKIAQINKENAQLSNDFLEYLSAAGRSETTIKNYRADLKIFFCWVPDNLDNKPFVEITKRDIVRFQNHTVKEWKWSPNRIRNVKACISSLGNYIEDILDDEYEGYRSIVNKVKSPPKAPVMEKTVWKEEELEALVSKLIENKRFMQACYVALGIYSGRRKSELLRFKVSDFGDDKLISGGALYKSDPIKTKGLAGGKYIRCYTLAKKFKPVFDLWMAERKRLGIESEWLFPDDDPKEHAKAGRIDAWTDYLSKLAGKPFYSHSMRHAFCTNLLEAGIPDSAVVGIVGWESSDMLKIYDDREVDDQIAGCFANGEIVGRKASTFSEIK